MDCNGKHRSNREGNERDHIGWLPRNWRQMAITLLWMVIVLIIGHCSGMGHIIMPQIPNPQWREDQQKKKDRHHGMDALADNFCCAHADRSGRNAEIDLAGGIVRETRSGPARMPARKAAGSFPLIAAG